MKEKGKIEKSGATAESLTETIAPDTDSAEPVKSLEKEINGPKGLEPTRYGDWESKGRCYDF